MNKQVLNIIQEIEERTLKATSNVGGETGDSFCSLRSFAEELQSSLLELPSVHLTEIDSNVSAVVSANPEAVRFMKDEPKICDAVKSVLAAVEELQTNNVMKPKDIKPEIEIGDSQILSLTVENDRLEYEKNQNAYERGSAVERFGRDKVVREVQNLLSLFSHCNEAPTLSSHKTSNCCLEFDFGQCIVRRTDNNQFVEKCGEASMRLLQFIADRHPNFVPRNDLADNWSKFGTAENPERSTVREGVSKANKNILRPLGLGVETNRDGARRITLPTSTEG